MIDSYQSCLEILKKNDKRITEYIIIESNILLKKIIQVGHPNLNPLANIIPLAFTNTRQDFIATFTSPNEDYTARFKNFLKYLQFLKESSQVTEIHYYLLELDTPETREFKVSVFPIAADVINILNISLQLGKIHYFKIHSEKNFQTRLFEDKNYENLFIDITEDCLDAESSTKFSQNLINFASLRPDQTNLLKKSLNQFSKALYIINTDLTLGLSMMVSSIEPLAAKYSTASGTSEKFIDFLFTYFPDRDKNLPNDDNNKQFKRMLRNLYEIRNRYLHGGIEIFYRGTTIAIVYNLRHNQTLKLLRIPSALFFASAFQETLWRFMQYLFERKKDPRDMTKYNRWEKDSSIVFRAKLQQNDGKYKVGATWLTREELDGRLITYGDIEHNFIGDYVDLHLKAYQKK